MSELKELQKQIEKAYDRPIRLEKTKKKRKEDLHGFLTNFFSKWNAEGPEADEDLLKDTVYADNHEIQTEGGRRRSLGDIFMICKYYYPDVTLEEVIRELYVDLREETDSGFRTSHCFTIQKRVWYFDETRKSAALNNNKYDEYGKPYRFYLAMLEGDEYEDVGEICPDCEQLLDDCTCGEDEEWEDDE